MKSHFSSVEAARVVEPILRAWELRSDMARRPGEMRFRLKGADVEDRTPAPPGVIRGTAHIVQPGSLVIATGTVSVHVTRGHYPEAPAETFRINPDVQK
jgi:hypothetical protein